MNTAGTVEAQSVVRIPPGLLSLAAQEGAADHQRQGARRSSKLSGRLLLAGEPAGGVKVGFSHGADEAAS